jgi:hypothetical protein
VPAAQLQRQRMFLRVIGKQALAIAVDDRVSVNHLGIKPGVPGKAAQEEPTVAVGPVHHRSHGQFANNGNTGISGVFVIFGLFFRLWHFCVFSAYLS